MENQSYYMRGISWDNCRDLTVPLLVNCTGYVKLAQPFSNTGQRKDWYLQLMNEGRLHSGEGDTLSAGQFILRSPERIYRYGLQEGSAMGYYWAHFTGSFVQQLLAENQIEPDRIYTLREEAMPALGREFGLLFREFMLRRPGFEHMAASLLTSILVRLGRGVLADSKDAMDYGLRKRLEQSAAYIHSHYTENISVGTLAAMEHLSDSRFREVFREAFGVPPSEYIIGLRIAHACELLLVTDLTVSQIAEVCGYPDVLYFSRLFHKKIGTPPLSYRKNGIKE